MSAAPKSAAPRAPLKNFFILPVQSFTEELGERISAARRACRLTQEEIAQKSRTSLSTYKRIEQGDTTVSIGTVFSVLYCLDNLESCEGILSDVTAVLHDETRLPQRVRHRKSPDERKDGPVKSKKKTTVGKRASKASPRRRAKSKAEAGRQAQS